MIVVKPWSALPLDRARSDPWSTIDRAAEATKNIDKAAIDTATVMDEFKRKLDGLTDAVAQSRPAMRMAKILGNAEEMRTELRALLADSLTPDGEVVIGAQLLAEALAVREQVEKIAAEHADLVKQVAAERARLAERLRECERARLEARNVTMDCDEAMRDIRLAEADLRRAKELFAERMFTRTRVRAEADAAMDQAEKAGLVVGSTSPSRRRLVIE